MDFMSVVIVFGIMFVPISASVFIRAYYEHKSAKLGRKYRKI